MMKEKNSKYSKKVKSNILKVKSNSNETNTHKVSSFSPNKNVKIFFLTTPSFNCDDTYILNELNKNPTRDEICKVQEILLQSNYMNEEEKHCLVQWHQKNIINSEFYHLNFILEEERKGSTFNADDSKILFDYHRRDIVNSPYHRLWIIQYFETKILKSLREEKMERKNLKMNLIHK